MIGKYGIGLTIGVGSIGFAVISEADARVEDFGIRFFDSGETADRKARKNHERRAYRNFRRLVRRRVHRKERVKAFLQKVGLITSERFKLWQEKRGDQNIFAVRVKGLSEKLTPEEIADCIIHICNHRGYSDYYNEEISSKEAGLIKVGLAEFEKTFNAGAYRSVADMFLNDDAFKTETAFPDYHNHKNNGRFVLAARDYVRQELLDILRAQQRYYPQLTDDNIKFLCDKVVFAQRDFEAGPGEENDKTRKFMSFLDNVGKCLYYKEENRAFRTTVIANVYALVNCLAQYTYINEESCKVGLPCEAAKAILDYALSEACISEKEVKAILKGFGLKMEKRSKLKIKLADTVSTLKILKQCLEKSGYNYAELVSEEQFDLQETSKLQRLCVLLCENITPKRRARALVANGWNESLCKALQHKRFGGTANVCQRYMVDVIKAFLQGERISLVKRKVLQEQSALANVNKQKFLPVFTKMTDEEIAKDVVIFKTVNEARKVINALIRKYDSPAYINVEVGGRFFARYIVNYLNDNLLFAGDENKNVHAVGRVTSLMREQVLKDSSWANVAEEDNTRFRLAVNAVVVANFAANDEYRHEKITFAEDLRVPLISYKQNKKYQGQFTADNPIAKKKQKESSIVKIDKYGNETVLNASKYYCVEIYKDREKKTALRGIRYVDLVKKDKKLFLVASYPENYLEHVMYLFQNDYIKIFDAKGNEKFAGFYRSVKAVTRNLINVRRTHAEDDEFVYVTQRDVFKKYDVDVLGSIGGEVKSSVAFETLPDEK